MEGLILRVTQTPRLTFAALHLCCLAVGSIKLRQEAKLERPTQNLSPGCKYVKDGGLPRRPFEVSQVFFIK